MKEAMIANHCDRYKYAAGNAGEVSKDITSRWKRGWCKQGHECACDEKGAMGVQDWSAEFCLTRGGQECVGFVLPLRCRGISRFLAQRNLGYWLRWWNRVFHFFGSLRGGFHSGRRLWRMFRRQCILQCVRHLSVNGENGKDEKTRGERTTLLKTMTGCSLSASVRWGQGV